MSIIEATPEWTKGDLRRLGQDLLMSDGMTPELRKRYNAVMLWHNDLAAEVATILSNTAWRSCPVELFDVTARPKTIDTLVQKLHREPRLSLDEVQDLAGVRIDADITLDVQTALAEEVAGRFGPRSRIRDRRDRPQSGYRAVHVWLRLPAGNVEIQIRTFAQSAWANTYERLGDRFGRGIRYGGTPEDEFAQETVHAMHRASQVLAEAEQLKSDLVRQRRQVDQLYLVLGAVWKKYLWREPIQTLRALDRKRRLRHEVEMMEVSLDRLMSTFVEQLQTLRRTLDQEEV